jgi:hypothetical protein
MPASAAAGHIGRHAILADPTVSASTSDAVCHSSIRLWVTRIRHSVRAIASAEIHAWCARKTSVRPSCWRLVTRSRPTAL